MDRGEDEADLTREVPILGADALPIAEWENPVARVELPAEIQRFIKAPTPYIRVAEAKHHSILRDHPGDEKQYRDLSQGLRNWERVGADPKRAQTWVVYYRDEEKWYLAVLGVDKNGSFNLVTHYGTSDIGWLENRWRTEIATNR